MRLPMMLFLTAFISVRLPAEEVPLAPPIPVASAPRVLVHRVDYTATLTGREARIRARYDVEMLDRGAMWNCPCSVALWRRPACETVATTHIAPAVITCTTVLGLEVVQGALARLEVALPAGQSLTRLQGEQLRDWQVTPRSRSRRSNRIGCLP